MVVLNNIGHIIIVEDVFNAAPNELILKNPINAINSKAIPTYFSFVISVGLTNLNPNSKLIIRANIISPSGKDLHNVIADMEIGPSNGVDKIIFGGFNFQCKNIFLEEEGEYKIVVSTDPGESKETILPVYKIAEL